MSTSSEVSEQHAAQVKLAAEAYIYGYPFVYGLREMAAFVAGGGRFPTQASYNALGHARQLAGPEFKFVTPNDDTRQRPPAITKPG